VFPNRLYLSVKKSVVNLITINTFYSGSFTNYSGGTTRAVLLLQLVEAFLVFRCVMFVKSVDEKNLVEMVKLVLENARIKPLEASVGQVYIKERGE